MRSLMKNTAHYVKWNIELLSILKVSKMQGV